MGRRDGKIAAVTLPLTIPGWRVPRADGAKLIAAARRHSGAGLDIELGGDPIHAAQGSSSPEAIGFLGAAIVLLVAFGSVVAAGLPLAIAAIGLAHRDGHAAHGNAHNDEARGQERDPSQATAHTSSPGALAQCLTFA